MLGSNKTGENKGSKEKLHREQIPEKKPQFG